MLTRAHGRPLPADSRPRLLVDLGGTHARLALQRPGAAPARIRVCANDDYPDLESLIADYLAATRTRPGVAGLAVACPVSGDRLRLTNREWSFSIAACRDRFGFERLEVLNDFAAVALALSELAPAERAAVGDGRPRARAPMAVLGPGTGLGVSGVVPCGSGWACIEGEGGHVTLAAGSAEEQRILDLLRAEFDHVSAERVLSGPGLLRLHRALAQLRGQPATATEPEGVTRMAQAGDKLAAQALEQFFAWLGAVAGDVALTLGARGGVYLAGGILPQLIAPLRRSGFRRRFLAKGRSRSYLEAIPTYVITAEFPVLRGLAAWLEQTA